VKIFGDIVLLKLFKQKNLRHMGDILEKWKKNPKINLNEVEAEFAS
jgi:hypothetical protein